MGFILKLPIISVITGCRKSDHKEAIIENLPSLIISTMPIWVGSFVMLITKDHSLLGAIYLNISNGELFLYATSLLGPIFYITLIDPPGTKQFPSRLSFTFAVLIIVILSAIAFSLQRVNIQLKSELVYYMSWIFFIISFCLLHIATTFRNSRITVTPEDFRNDEQNLTSRLMQHRG